MSGHMQDTIAIHCSTLFNCEVATNRSTLERLRDGHQYLVIGFFRLLILRASLHFDSFESSVHCFLFSSRLTYLSDLMEATTADKATHSSAHLNSSSPNQQVDSWAYRKWIDIYFSSTAEWSVPSHLFLFCICFLRPIIFLTWKTSKRKYWISSLCAPVESNAYRSIIITSVVI